MCNHSMDLGVICPAYSDACTDQQDRTTHGQSSTTFNCDTNCSLQTDRNQSSNLVTMPATRRLSISSATSSISRHFETDTAEWGGSIFNEQIACTSEKALGGVVGVLVTVLVVLAIGWSLSCVVLMKRNTHTPKQIKYVPFCLFVFKRFSSYIKRHMGISCTKESYLVSTIVLKHIYIQIHN